MPASDPAVRLLADCGNSTVKFALAHGGALWMHQRLDPVPASWDGALEAHRDGIAELVVVGTGRTTPAVLAWWRQSFPDRPLRRLGHEIFAPGLGTYAGFGLDRLCAGLAGCTQARSDLLVIDAGTATTLSAWRWDARTGTEPEAGPGPPVGFAGGLILPGARACIVGLAELASALPPVSPGPADSPACQRSTAGAIAAAMGIGYGSMVKACWERLRDESGISAVMVTGGNAQALLGTVLPRQAYRPALVLEGLEMICSGLGGAVQAP